MIDMRIDKGARNEWHCRKGCMSLRFPGRLESFLASFFSRLGEQVVRFGPASDGARFHTVGSVSDAMGCAMSRSQ